jgi:hypothetical protein
VFPPLACSSASRTSGLANRASLSDAFRLFALVFPVGLSMVTNCGAELYTGNTMMLTCAVIEKRATWGQLIKNWVVSYMGELRRRLTHHGLSLLHCSHGRVRRFLQMGRTSC